jgi:hypothetical protein
MYVHCIAVNAHDVLIDSVAAFKKNSKKKPETDDDDLITRALSLVETLKNRSLFKAEIGEWKFTLKHQSMAEFVELLHRTLPEELNPTVTNMMKQSIDKRMASEHPAELRDVLLVRCPGLVSFGRSSSVAAVSIRTLRAHNQLWKSVGRRQLSVRIFSSRSGSLSSISVRRRWQGW